MSWLKAIEEVCQRAGRGATRSLFSPKKTFVLSPRHTAPLPFHAFPPNHLHSPATIALHDVSDTWRASLALVQFSATLHSAKKDLCETMRHLPLSRAAQCAGILLEAGQVDPAMDLMTTWKPKTKRPSIRVKAAAARRLRASMRTLCTIGDVESLRASVALLHRALLGQQQRRRRRATRWTSQTRPNEHETLSTSAPRPERGAEEETVSLLAALGPQRVGVVLIDAVHALLTQREAPPLVSLEEMWSWVNAAALAVSPPLDTPGATPLVPWTLQRDLRTIGIRRAGDEARRCSPIAPALRDGMLGVKECSPLHLLRAPRTELRRWQHQRKRNEKDTHPTPQEVLNYTLVEMLCAGNDVLRGKPPKRSMTEAEWALRRVMISKLRSSHVNTRRIWAAALLRRPFVLYRLRLSPPMVLCVCALTFCSYEPHVPFARLCLRVVCHLHRRGRRVEAARMVWNHLSTPSDSLAALFARHPLRLEGAVGAICHAMRYGVGGRGGRWMGHRSLAVLRCADTRGMVTPSHCIPVCAAAMDCGVHFATIQQFVGEIYATDAKMRDWVIDMIRLTTRSHVARLLVPVGRSSQSTTVCALLRRYAYNGATSSSPLSVEVCVPSRSRLIALWVMVNDESMSEALRRLVCRLFVDEEVRRHFSEGDYAMKGKDLVSSSKEGTNGEQTEQRCAGVRKAVHEFFAEEVLASVASNCTTEESYNMLMRALLAQRRKRDVRRCMQLMLSEAVDKESNDSTVAHVSKTSVVIS